MPEVEDAIKQTVNFSNILAAEITDNGSKILESLHIPIASFVLGKCLRKTFEIHELRKNVAKGERLAEIFSGYEDPRKLKCLLTQVFEEIFLNFNVQFALIKPHLIDSERKKNSTINDTDRKKMILAVAQDVIMRMFHFIESAKPFKPENETDMKNCTWQSYP